MPSVEELIARMEELERRLSAVEHDADEALTTANYAVQCVEAGGLL